MKKQNRGFTIVELVIVIAVIAILAAVLIPTFSSLVKKADLSADMQAVRAMNTYLKAQEQAGNKATSVEKAMRILAEGGFDSDVWVCKTKGYKMYWFQEKNIMVLYSPKGEGDLVYPEEVANKTWKNSKGEKVNYFTADQDEQGNPIHLWPYNAHMVAATELETDLSNSSTIKDNGSGSSAAELTNSSDIPDSEKVALSNAQTAVESSVALRNSLGFANTQMYVYASKEERSSEGSAYATLQILQVGDNENPQLSNSTVSTGQGNLFVVNIRQTADATQSSINQAQKDASEYVYSLFVQMNNKQIASDANILLAPGITLDASEHEWAPVKGLGGYMGTTDANNPVIFKGGLLTADTSYAETLYFRGSGGTYLVTGFIGALYGNATFENFVYEDTTIQNPAQNFDLSLSNQAHSRNTVSIIGAVVDEKPRGPKEPAPAVREPSNVTVRNIVVKSSVTITGMASAAGLIGYVGGAGSDNALFNGTLTIENCHVSAKVTGGLETSDYGPCGGLIAFSCRAVETSATKDGSGNNNEIYNIVIKDCIFDGSVDGYTDIGAVMGNMVTGSVIFMGVNDFSGAKLNNKGYSASDRYIGSLIGRVPKGCPVSFEYADEEHILVGDNSVYPYFNIEGVNKTAAVNAAGYYDASKSACQGRVTTLANVRPNASLAVYDSVSFTYPAEQEGDDPTVLNVGANDGIY